MTAILKRELKAYFTSMLGYVYLTIFLLISGAIFIFGVLRSGTTSMNDYFGIMLVVSALILPILTMRLFAEDRKLKTDQLLLTAPIGIHEMVLGKYFAAVGVFLVGAAITMLYPITLSLFGTIPLAETISCYVGYILFCAALISIGAYMSSLTENQIVAAVSTYGVVLLIIVVQMFVIYKVKSAVIANMLLWLSPIGRYSDFTMGVLNIESIVFYLSVIAVFVILTVRTFEKRRWN